MANEFRTVQYQGSQVNRQGGVNVSSGQAALDSDASYQQRQLARAGEALQSNNNLALRQAQQLDQIEVDNQRLVAAQMAAKNDAILRAEDMYGRQKLANAQMRSGWKDQIGKLQLSQMIASDGLRQQISANETAALTQLGEQIVGFSKTLWQVKANDTNRKNQELQAQGFLDEMYGLGQTTGSDVARVDQAQYSRLAAQGGSEQVARQLESAGMPNDASRIRADNPFYAYGRQEAMALKAGTDIRSHLDKAVQAAKDSGALVNGTKDFDVNLRLIMKQAAREFVIQNNLQALPPAIGRRYFAQALLEAETAVASQANKENNIYIKQAQGLIAKNNAMLAFDEVGRNPMEAQKIVSERLNMPGDMEQNLRELFMDYVGQAEATGNWAPVEAIMQHGMMQTFRDDYAKRRDQYDARVDSQMEKANQEYFELQKAQFQMQLRSASPGELPDIRRRALEVAATMPAKYRNAFEQEISTARQGDFTSENIELDDIVRRSGPGEVTANLQQWKRDNPNATPQAIEQADKLIKQYEKAMEPWAKKLLEEFSGIIDSAEDPQASAGRAMDAGYNAKVKEIKRRRKEELENRFKVMMSRLGGGATEDALRDWWISRNKDLAAPIRPDVNGNFAELDRSNSRNPVTTAGPAVQRVMWNGRSTVDLTHNDDQYLIIKGRYGRINLQDALVLRPEQLIDAARRFQAGEQQTELVKKAAAAANVTEEAFIRVHLAAYKVPGTLDRPQDIRQTSGYRAGVRPSGNVSRDFIVDFARSKNLSQRGAIFFAQSIMDESGGNPNTVHDQGTGFGLWGARLDRRERMIAYAKSQGVPPNDPVAQMEYALKEIKDHYPSYWKILTSANPTTQQLIRVSQGWLRYDELLRPRRAESLRNVLGN